MSEFREVAPEPVEREAFDPKAYEGFAMGAGQGAERLESQDVVDEGASSGSGWRGRPLSEFHERYPREYLEARAFPTECQPFGDPADLAKTVNPKFPGDLREYERGAPAREAAQPYTVNCVDCSRAVEERWRGRLETAAGLQGRDGLAVDGEGSRRLDEWTGEEPTIMNSVEDVRQRLSEAGHGASAVIIAHGVEPDGSAIHHAYNVVNYQGEVRVIDGQLGRDFAWSAGTGHPLYDRVDSASVHGWDAEGRSLWSK